jgi:hypothetical protein
MENLATVGKYTIAINEDGLYLVLDEYSVQVGPACALVSSAVEVAKDLTEAQ